MPVQRLITIVLILACLVIAACVPLTPAETALPSMAVATFTPLSTARPSPTPTSTLPPSDTAQSETPAVSMPTGSAPDIVLPGWVPEGALRRIGMGAINQVKLSGDGTVFAVAGRTGIFLHRSDTFESIWSIPTTKAVGQVAFSADGRVMAAFAGCRERKGYPVEGGDPECLDQNELLIVNAITGSILLEIPLEGGPEEGGEIALSADGREVLVAEQHTGVRILDAGSGVLLRTIPLTDPIEHFDAVAFSANGQSVAVGYGYIGRIDVLDVQSEAVTRSTLMKPGYITALAITPDGSKVAAGMRSETTNWILLLGTGSLIIPTSEHQTLSLDFSPDAERIASGDLSGRAIVWDATNGHSLRAFQNPVSRVNSVRFLPGGKSLLSASGDKVSVWNTSTGESSGALEDVFSDWQAARYEEDTERIGLAAVGRVLRISTADYSTRNDYPIPQNAVLSQNFLMYAEIQSDLEIRFSYSSSGRVLSSWKGPDYLGKYYSPPRMTEKNFVFSTDDRSVYTIDWDTHSIQGWDMQSGVRLREYHYPMETYRLAFSPDGSLMAIESFAAEHGHQVDVYAAKNGILINSFWNHLDLIADLSRDNRRIATGCENVHGEKNLCLYELHGKELISSFTIEAAGDWISHAAISADGSKVAVGTSMGRVMIWDAETGLQSFSFRGHTGIVKELSFSPDGKILASTGDDGSVILWNVEG